ncbi:MAG: nucleotide sugar dehydrogenase [Ectothiorhodospiraceae bacterium]|nr:nucleotide sugar dehydrogenase [Chromatiales bacterium]MCP5155646.1 nucleotide sugar dehydrogenase [Ectothiorhodospiraceae bacterium]
MAHGRKISVTGLGYVGLPVAVAFGKSERVVGFDVNAQRVAELKAGHDRTHEVADADLAAADVLYTCNAEDLRAADFHIVAVPTPIDDAKQPDLGPLRAASRSVGAQLKRGDIVVFESTVYPGATEEDCVPVLEAASGLRCGSDFTVGYSPERINPGDREHTFTRITKVVSGQDAATLEVVAQVYESVVTAGVHRAATIKVAEAAKVIENTQRDLNIALMNELALIFDRMGIDTRDVLAAAGTKWNFLPFSPGLVGGHCIGVDPYYLTHKAAMLDYYPQVILAGRRINDGMGQHIAAQIVKSLIRRGESVHDALVTVLGLTFKENVPDLRNTKVIDIVHALEDYGIAVQVHDPMADADEARHEYGIELVSAGALRPARCVVLAVAHDDYVRDGWVGVTGLLERGEGVVVDVKGVLPREARPAEVLLWRL